jgi:uncharacterized protein (DUF1015 family)
MAVIKPFKGIRPAPDKVHLVASRPVDSYNSKELNAKLAENPYTFLHIIKPEFGKENNKPQGSEEHLLKVKKKFTEFSRQNILIKDELEGFYIYRQIKEETGKSYTGIIGCAAIDDYINNVIKKHEQTLTRKEQVLKDYLKVCNFNAEPVCLTYPSDEVIDELLFQIVSSLSPVYDFTTTDKKRHQLWYVSDLEHVETIFERFEKIASLYIADGHHRSASSVLLGLEQRNQNNNWTGDEPWNYFMAIYFPEHQLDIFDYNRAVKDLNGLSVEEFLTKISENFIVEKKGKISFQPETLHNFSLYLEGEWYSLSLKNKGKVQDTYSSQLDTAILSDIILAPVLDITDLKTDKRVAFIDGMKGPEGLKKIVDSGKMKAAFGLYPVTFEQLKKVSDLGETMPPKSTWIEPKLRSGLVMYNLE